MKQLNDTDIEQMIANDFVPNTSKVQSSVRKQLHLSTRIPKAKTPQKKYEKLDLHHLTEEQAWAAIMTLAQSGVRDATIITGASGILRVKFQQWATDSLFSPHIISWAPLNNGSFSVKFKKHKTENQ
jgi:DNA-nicking Smr family endonuclease